MEHSTTESVTSDSPTELITEQVTSGSPTTESPTSGHSTMESVTSDSPTELITFNNGISY